MINLINEETVLLSESIERLNKQTFYLIESVSTNEHEQEKTIEEVRIIGTIRLEGKNYFLYEYTNYPTAKKDLDLCFEEMDIFMQESFLKKEDIQNF